MDMGYESESKWECNGIRKALADPQGGYEGFQELDIFSKREIYITVPGEFLSDSSASSLSVQSMFG